MKAIGITATDTEFGKTVVSACLAAGFKQMGLDTGGKRGRRTFNERRRYAGWAA